jgi:DNA topoisomerase-2
VAQFSGYVSENSCYHHGEASLQASIIGLAQNFVGSNNINLFVPSGQFGTRIHGGKDSASPRYIFTYLNQISRLIYPKEDDCILEFLEDDGIHVEPNYYLPIIPMILVNGCCGVGTGFSTSIPSYKPSDLIDRIESLLNDEESELESLVPWYNKFQGEISLFENNKYVSKGIWKRTSALKLEITELPIGMWTNDYIEFLEKFIDTSENILKDFQSHHTDDIVKFVLTFHKKEVLDEYCENVDKLLATFKLTSSNLLSQTNMHLFDENMRVTKYADPLDIIRAYYPIRLRGYEKRKEMQLTKMDKDIKLISAKVRFIKDVIDEEVIISNTPIEEINLLLDVKGYDRINDTYDYLINLPIRKLTMEEKQSLEDELDKLMKSRDELYNTTSKELWKRELNELRKKI